MAWGWLWFWCLCVTTNVWELCMTQLSCNYKHVGKGSSCSKLPCDDPKKTKRSLPQADHFQEKWDVWWTNPVSYLAYASGDRWTLKDGILSTLINVEDWRRVNHDHIPKVIEYFFVGKTMGHNNWNTSWFYRRRCWVTRFHRITAHWAYRMTPGRRPKRSGTFDGESTYQKID